MNPYLSAQRTVRIRDGEDRCSRGKPGTVLLGKKEAPLSGFLRDYEQISLVQCLCEFRFIEHGPIENRESPELLTHSRTSDAAPPSPWI